MIERARTGHGQRSDRDPSVRYTDPGWLNVADLVICRTSCGPGRRIELSVRGCDKRCPGCCNQDFQEHHPTTLISSGQVAAAIEQMVIRHDVSGLTVSGGEPLLQAGGLLPVLATARHVGLDIIVFTGMIYEEVLREGRQDRLELLGLLDVLIDGPFVQGMNTSFGLAGSANQRYLYLTDRLWPLRNEIEGKPKTRDYLLQEGMLKWAGYPLEGGRI